MAQSNDIVQKIFIGAIVAIVTVLATLALAGPDSVPRPEVEAMISTSETRLTGEIRDIKRNQEVMAQKIEQILSEQARIGVKLDTLMGRNNVQVH